jgi:hypothetical protein
LRSHAVEARVIVGSAQKALHFMGEIRVNHKSITSHAQRAPACCKTRMALSRKSNFKS